MRLEACDCLGATSLPHDIDCLTNTHRDRKGFALLVHGHQHARLRSDKEIIKHVMVLAQNCVLHVKHCKRNSDESGQGNIRVQRTVRMRRREGQKTLSHVYEALSHSNKEQK